MNKKDLLSDVSLLSIGTGLIYLWFGGLKFFPSYSPAEELATQTVELITFGIIEPSISILILAVWEVAVGIFLIFNFYRRQTAILGLVHIFFTFFPLLLFYDQSFSNPPFGFSLLGQYIFKNVLIISSFIVIYRNTPVQKIIR